MTQPDFQTAFQDVMPRNHCWGCGPDVPGGLRLKTRWDPASPDKAVCIWTPRPEFAAGPRTIVYGGTIASVIDCHGIWTAIGDVYRREERPVGEGELVWFVTGALNVSYRKPTPIDQPMTVHAWVREAHPRKSLVSISLVSAGVECATGDMVAVRVPPSWYDEQGS
ncbi:MAG: PaaI family thioesterase [Chloroflexota bacterium]